MGSQNGILCLILKLRRLFVKPLFCEILKKAACVICHFIRKILTHTFIEEKFLSVKCSFLIRFRSLVLDCARVSTVKMLKYKESCSKFGLL